MASIVYRYLSFVANDVIFFSGDVQTTTIAVAIASSLCCSIVWAVFHIISVVQPTKGTTKTKTTPLSFCKVPVSRKTGHQTVYTDDSAMLEGDEVEVPCVRCGKYYADAHCRFVTCKQCCFSVTACNFHHENRDIKCRLCRSQHKRVQEIDLSYCEILQCPERLGFVGAQLTLLNLAQNRLYELPSEIGCLRGLKDLYIDHNYISVLPDTIGSLVSLQSLNVSFNQIHNLPDSMCSLQNLKVLRAGHNNIEDIPRCVCQIHSLTGLYLEHNKLTSSDVQWSSLGLLEILVLNNNPLSTLPNHISNMIHLQELDVSSCDLHVIPSSICYCPNLTSLDLSHNQLSILPVEFGSLHTLKEFHINNNKLHSLPSTIDLDRYQNITVSDNPFCLDEDFIQVHSPRHLFPSLLEISLRFISNHGNYNVDILPQVLQDMLKEKKTCTRCGRVFITYYQSNIQLKHTVQGNIPFYSQICSPHQTECSNQT